MVPMRWPAPRSDAPLPADPVCCCLMFMRPARPGLTSGTRCRPSTCDARCRRACGPRRRWPPSDPLRQPGAPGFQGGPLCNPAHDDPGCLEQMGAQQRVTMLRDMAGVVVFAGLKAPRHQADVGAHAGRLHKTLPVVDDAGVGQRHQDARSYVMIPTCLRC